ncbi:MAG: hypothetical protein AAF996_09700 [Pseudomonadota bacterium]
MFTSESKFMFAAAAIATLALAPASAEDLVLEGQTWSAQTNDGSAAQIESYLGRDALFLRRNVAVLDGVELGDMVIEYDYASTHASGFIGVNFRADSETANLEQFYTRPHQSGQPDATQYMVMTNGSATWQLHAGPNEAVATELPPETWIKVRIVAIGDQADIFVGDMTAPLIHVPDLRSVSQSGKVALYASDRPWMRETGAYFSNISIRAATSEDVIIGTPNETDPLPEGLIDSFDISAPFAETEIADAYQLPVLDVLNGPWTSLNVENDGVANISRTTAMQDGKNTALVRFTVSADENTTRMLSFGYSDRVRLFVNGKLVYSGNAQWRSRDHRFLGTVALVDQIALHLAPGETEIVAAVSESFGGWGFKAALSGE